MRRHLVIRLAALGDLAMSSALARRIRENEPDAEISWLCGRSGVDLVRLFPEVDRVLAIDDTALLRGGTLQRFRELSQLLPQVFRRYDRVYLVHADKRYRVLSGMFRGHLTALDRNLGRMSPIPGRYFADECARLYDGSTHQGPIEGHYPLSDPRSKLPPFPSAAGRAADRPVVLVPGGTRNVLREDRLRRWPAESYRLLAEALIQEGRTVLIVGDRHDEWAQSMFSSLPVRDLIGKLTIGEALRVMAEAAAVVSHDTGPMHLARLVRAPLVAIFGPTRPTERLIEDDRTIVIWGGEDLACRPCYDGREFARCESNVCISRVDAARVLRAARVLLGRQDQRPTVGLQLTRT